MDRRLFYDLERWKVSSRRKPLILMGARQVGKTYLLQQFGRRAYADFVYLNFENNPPLKRLFKESLKPKDILRNITIETEKTITAGKTLIILDEIQECPEALNCLKYFCEEANDYHICAAGSLLGVKLAHTKGFPVGKVDFLHLYPLGFFEFLQALGKEKLIEAIEEPFLEFIHEKLLHLFKIYTFVGGMPEAVVCYKNTQDFLEIRKIQEAILNAYSLDFAKHAPSDHLMKINQIWQSIPGQLAKENKKFIYSAIRKGARAKEFETAIQWLSEAGLIHKVYQVSTAKIPLEAYASFDFFKIYLIDVGLLGAMARLSPKSLIDGNALFEEFRGSLAENFVAQELAKRDYKLYYWTSSGQAEIDYLIQYEEDVYPLEVKSGSSKRKKSLHVYCKKYKPKISVRISPMNFKREKDLLNCPFYLLGKLDCFLAASTKY